MKKIKRILGSLFLFTSLFIFATPKKKLRVAASKDAAPFSFMNEKGEVTGIAIEIWEKIAQQLKLSYEIKTSSLKQRLRDARDNKIDLAISATTINSTREAFVDFSHPFYETGLGIAVNKSHQGVTLGSLFSALINKRTFLSLGLLILVLFTFGFLAWLFEHKKNPEQYRTSPGQGIWDGFWWSAVTLATVGYGDKAPKTFMGRVIGLIWMLCSVVILAFLTASIASILTVSSLQSKINGLKDLRNSTLVTGTYQGTTGETFLKKQGIRHQTFKNIQEGLEALSKQEIDAFVYDRPLMQYIIRKQFSDTLFVTKSTFAKQRYGFVFQQGSPLREEFNKALLKILEDESYWKNLKQKYLGSGS